jgi:hypothetical protein
MTDHPSQDPQPQDDLSIDRMNWMEGISTSTSFYGRSGSSLSITTCIEGSAHTNLVHLNVIAGGSGNKITYRELSFSFRPPEVHILRWMLASNTCLSFGHERTTPQAYGRRSTLSNESFASDPSTGIVPGLKRTA